MRWNPTRKPEAVDRAAPVSELLAAEDLLDQADMLHRMAYRLTGNREQAEDLVQDSFVKLIGAAPRFENKAKARAWLVTTLTHLFIDRYRRHVRDARMIQSQAAEEPYVFSEDDRTALDAIDRFEDDEIRSAYQALDEESRVVVWLFDVEGFNYQEISRILDMPSGTVGSRLHRARKRLRGELAALARKRGYSK